MCFVCTTGRRMPTAISTLVRFEHKLCGADGAGHALNKVLKDMINRYRLLRGDTIQCVISAVERTILMADLFLDGIVMACRLN